MVTVTIVKPGEHISKGIVVDMKVMPRINEQVIFLEDGDDKRYTVVNVKHYIDSDYKTFTQVVLMNT